MTAIDQQTRKWLREFNLPVDIPGAWYVNCEETLGHRYGAAMRLGLSHLDVTAYYCVNDVPVLAIVRGPVDNRKLGAMMRRLWNQGLANVLAVVSADEVSIYSLNREPSAKTEKEVETRLVETLDLVNEVLAFRQFLTGVTSGRWFEDHASDFPVKERVDERLLANLAETEKRLVKLNLEREAARALVIQTVFLAYLEDRELIGPRFLAKALGEGLGMENSLDVLQKRDPALLGRLFSELHYQFNGNVFFGPCAFGPDDENPTLEKRHIDCLIGFREGKYHMASGQQQFWPYDFRYIPVELISAIYDRLLSDEASRKSLGSYFTPHYLAEFSVNEAWDNLPEHCRYERKLRILDPACGSGVFLVMALKRVCEQQRALGRDLNWTDLKEFVQNLYGIDLQPAAVRLTIFSLYIAMLEEMEDALPDALYGERPVFPTLWGESLITGSFFDKQWVPRDFDLVIGNPPWSSRTNKSADANKWCKEHGKPIPSGESAWAFLWRAIEVAGETGQIALLLPAMGVLHNHGGPSVDARRRLFECCDVDKVVDFSDISFQLFRSVKRPTILFIGRAKTLKERELDAQEIEYFCPKVSRVFHMCRTIPIESIDRHCVKIRGGTSLGQSWKPLIWATARERKLLARIGGYRTLGELFRPLKKCTAGQRSARKDWIIGQGFKAPSLTKVNRYSLRDVADVPYLSAKRFTPFSLPQGSRQPYGDQIVYRAGFKEAYRFPKILIPQGIERADPRVRAAFCEEALTFEASLQAITFPENDVGDAKLLTVLLNSSLASWYLFHSSANWGTDRAKVHEEQLTLLPFPAMEELPDPQVVEQCIQASSDLLDEARRASSDTLIPTGLLSDFQKRADEIAFQFFDLTENERALIEDSLHYVMPSIQPGRKRPIPIIREHVKYSQLRMYAETLQSLLKSWSETADYSVRISSGHSDLVIAEIVRGDDGIEVDHGSKDIFHRLDQIRARMAADISGGISMVPNVAVWEQDRLVLIKPNELRYWLRSTALNDADAIGESLLRSSPSDALA